MIGLALRLSRKIGVDGRAQIIVKLTMTPKTRPNFKTGIYVKPEWVKTTRTKKGNKYSIVPPNSNANEIDVFDAIDAKNRLDSFCNLMLRICQITMEHDPDKLTRDWVDACYKAIVKEGLALRDINFTLLQQMYDSHIKCIVLPNEKSYNGNFFKMTMAFVKAHPRGQLGGSMRSLAKILSRYERYVQLTDKKRPKFKLEISQIDRFSIIEIQDYMLHEAEYVIPTGKLIEIAKNNPDLPCRRTSIYAYIDLKRGSNTVNAYMITFKAFFNWLMDLGIKTKDPFKGLVNHSPKYGIPFYLTIEERNKVAEWNFGDRVKLIVARDIFIFQCLTGCRYGDLSRLTPANISDGMLQYYPNKTKELSRSNLVKVPLCKKAKQLIELYAGTDSKGRLFPVVGNELYNTNIKIIMKECGITRNVPVRDSLTGQEIMKPICDVASSHMARRTFIGAAYKAVKDPNLIGKMSGHVEGSKAFTRYRTIDEEDLKEVIDMIQ